MGGPSPAEAPFAIERLVYGHWGGPPGDFVTALQALSRIARREGWTFSEVADIARLQSVYLAHEWQDCYGKVIGWTLLAGNIAAVATRRPEWGLPPDFHLTSAGPLAESLSADGSLVLPDAAWLLAPLTEEEKAAIRAGQGREANDLRKWKPHTRAEALFNHWD